MLNYRARQLLSLIHASPLVEFATRLDPRLTYRFDEADYFADSVFDPQILELNDNDGALKLIGEPTLPDVTGRMRHSVRVEVNSADTVRVRIDRPVSETVYDIAFENGLSNKVLLGRTGYQFRLTDTVAIGDVWLVETLHRPQWDMGQLAANLERVGEDSLLAVFGTSSAEPYATFRNLWNKQGELPLRLGAFVMALVYATEARRG